LKGSLPKVKAARDVAEAGVVGMCIHFQLVQGPVDDLDRLAQFPAHGSHVPRDPVVHKGRVVYGPADIRLSAPLQRQRPAAGASGWLGSRRRWPSATSGAHTGPGGSHAPLARAGRARRALHRSMAWGAMLSPPGEME
jgi:hypothetical protein